MSAVWCGCYITLNSRENNPVNLQYGFPEKTVSSTTNTDAHPFAGYEPNAAAGQEDLGVTSTSHRRHKKEGAAEPEDPWTELLKRVLAGNRDPDISQVKLAKMPASTGSRGLPPATAWQDWFTIRLRTWANVISPEFKAELVKKVLGQHSDLSRHGTADEQLAHEICFNIDDKMLPYLLGADLSLGCAILRVLQEEILASTAEHTAALHEMFAKPVPCRDKTKLLLTLRQWITDLKELQAAKSSPSQETVMQSLKTVTGGIRDLNNVQEITDLPAPNDPGSGDRRRHPSQRQRSWNGNGCQRLSQRRTQRNDSL